MYDWKIYYYYILLHIVSYHHITEYHCIRGRMDTDVRRGTSGTSRDAPIFVHFLKKDQNSYTLVVKNPKFVHFGGR